jgi:fructose-1-phosphate kinase PfkB-like protein
MKLFFLQISALTAVAVSATINNEVTPKQKVSSSIGEGDAMIQGVIIAFV